MIIQTNIFKITTILLILSGCFSSCTKKGENAENANEDCLSIIRFINEVIHDESSSILGKWKLEKSAGIRFAWQYGDPGTPYQCDDYSQSNIVFEFKTDNVLTISAEIDFYLKGEHTYSFVEYNEWYGREIGLKIGEYTDFGYQNSSKELVLNLMPVDGPAYYLVKID